MPTSRVGRDHHSLRARIWSASHRLPIYLPLDAPFPHQEIFQRLNAASVCSYGRSGAIPVRSVKDLATAGRRLPYFTLISPVRSSSPASVENRFCSRSPFSGARDLGSVSTNFLPS